MNLESTTVRRVKLNEIYPEITNALIVGIIIAKQRPRNISVGGNNNEERAVWNFTLRDSPMFYINVTCWSSTLGIAELNNKFRVGDVVDIERPQIEIRKYRDNSEHFRPNVTSPYFLTLNDFPELNIHKHEGNCNMYYSLLPLPTKPIAGAYTISTIHSKHEKLEGVDIIGILRQVGKIRSITTRSGIEQSVRELMVFDQTNSNLRITMWDPDLIERANIWKCLNTVLFVTNLRCEWSAFSRCMVASLTSSSIVTEDPSVPETNKLREYAQEIALQPPTDQNLFTSIVPNPLSINKIMNIQQILKKVDSIINSDSVPLEEQQFTALVYAFVTQLDLDGFSRCIIMKCSFCESIVSTLNSVCTNSNCNVATDSNQAAITTYFDIRVMLSDHTGSLVNCRLSGKTAEALLNCSVQQFLLMNIEEKTALKWKFLIERCAVRILVMCSGLRNSSITILSCELASSYEVSNNLTHY